MSGERASIFVTVAALLFLATSCAAQDSRDDPEGASTPGEIQAETPRERRLLAAVQQYNDGFYTGDYETVHGMRNDLCGELSWEEGLQGLVQRAADRYGEPQPITSFKAEVKRRIAFATYTFEDRRLNVRREAWTSSRAGWEWGDC